uniref:BPTI/Kunitz inhibitor domain-containing protein n=1 Tax=Steinernema glaseri TaxID=37863 RepID=A0A1I8AD16_9BILA
MPNNGESNFPTRRTPKDLHTPSWTPSSLLTLYPGPPPNLPKNLRVILLHSRNKTCSQRYYDLPTRRPKANCANRLLQYYYFMEAPPSYKARGRELGIM